MKIQLRLLNLREVPVGTIVITTKGFEFELISRVDGKEQWLDKTSNLVWHDVEGKNIGQYEAEKRQGNGKRFPTIVEFKEAEERGFREVLTGMKDRRFWSSTPYPGNSEVAYVFRGYDGNADGYQYREGGSYYVDCRFVSRFGEEK
jgi:hypothetical protein